MRPYYARTPPGRRAAGFGQPAPAPAPQTDAGEGPLPEGATQVWAFRCPSPLCDTELIVPPEQAGQWIECPTCGCQMRAPHVIPGEAAEEEWEAIQRMPDMLSRRTVRATPVSEDALDALEALALLSQDGDVFGGAAGPGAAAGPGDLPGALGVRTAGGPIEFFTPAQRAAAQAGQAVPPGASAERLRFPGAPAAPGDQPMIHVDDIDLAAPAGAAPPAAPPAVEELRFADEPRPPAPPAFPAVFPAPPAPAAPQAFAAPPPPVPAAPGAPAPAKPTAGFPARTAPAAPRDVAAAAAAALEAAAHAPGHPAPTPPRTPPVHAPPPISAAPLRPVAVPREAAPAAPVVPLQAPPPVRAAPPPMAEDVEPAAPSLAAPAAPSASPSFYAVPVAPPRRRAGPAAPFGLPDLQSAAASGPLPGGPLPTGHIRAPAARGRPDLLPTWVAAVVASAGLGLLAWLAGVPMLAFGGLVFLGAAAVRTFARRTPQ